MNYIIDNAGNNVIDIAGCCLVSNQDTLTIQGNTAFFPGNILRMKDGVNDEWMTVCQSNCAPAYCVERDMANTYTANTLPAWTKGTTVVNYGNAGAGMVYMTASDPYAPYVSVVTQNGTPWNNGITTQMRMGNLNGFLNYANDTYGVGIGDSNASMTYDCVNGMVICSNASRTVFDGYGIRGYDSCNSLKFQVCNGHVTASDIFLQDPNCACNYSYLYSGALQFHDQLGNVPYVKRLCSGTSNTGCFVVLNGWTSSPQVMVSVKNLMSYNACAPTQCQGWQVYSDPPLCYYTSSQCYGYCFAVHALLTTYNSTGVECIKDVNFGTSVCTEACTCASTVRFKFQLWCNLAAPSCYYYGTICYALCYRVCGAGSYCACCYSYSQPYGSLAQLQTDQDTYATLSFPCMAVWDILACQVGSITWTNTGICSSGHITCVCCRNFCNGTSSIACTTTSNSTCCKTACTPLLITGSNPSLIYCNVLCYYWCSVPSQNIYDEVSPSCSCYATACSGAFAGAGAYFTTITNCVSSYSTLIRDCCFCGCYSQILCPTASYSCAFVCSTMGLSSPYGVTIAYMCHCVCNGYLMQCYCVPSGAAQCCIKEHLYSLCDSFGCYTTLDPNGVLNWLAVAYS